jgi:hypothetical protein
MVIGQVLDWLPKYSEQDGRFWHNYCQGESRGSSRFSQKCHSFDILVASFASFLLNFGNLLLCQMKIILIL